MIADSVWTPTAISALIIAVTGLLGGVGGLILVLRGQNQTHEKQDSANTALGEVHDLVNNQLDTVMTKNADLADQLKVAKTQPAETTPTA